MDWTAIVVGLLLGAYCVGWGLDFRGWITRLLRRLYRTPGPSLWPFGNEEEYATFMRYGGWFGVVVGAVLVVFGAAHH